MRQRRTGPFLDALSIIWRSKFILVLGILSALCASEISSARARPQLRFRTGGGSALMVAYATDLRLFLPVSGSSIARFAVVVVLAILLWFVSLLGQASLILAIGQLNENGKRLHLSLRESVQKGCQCLLSVAGVSLLLYGPYFVVSALIGQALIATNYGAGTYSLAVLILFPGSILLAIIYRVAQCDVVLRGLGVLPSVINAWRAIWKHALTVTVTTALLALIAAAFRAIVQGITFSRDRLLSLVSAWIQRGIIVRASASGAALFLAFGVLSIVLSGVLQTYILAVVTCTYESVES